MAGPHPGKWELVEQNAEVNATHAILLYTGKVLYFRSGSPRPDGTSESRIWDPASGAISTQIIPKWPAPPNNVDPPLLFCSGHCALPDGKILVAGGHRQPPEEEVNGEFRGLEYTYVFDPVSETWTPAGTQQAPHEMADGRWYPTVTALGEPRDELTRRAVAMSGYRREFSGGQSVVNDDPETYNPDQLLGGWSLMDDLEAAKQPFPNLYPGAHLVPRGDYAGKIFYSMPMLQAYIFDLFATGGAPYWTPIASPRSQVRSAGSSALLPIRPPNNEAKVLIIGGGNPAVNTLEMIDLNDSSGPSWQAAESLFFSRRNCDAVLLPDGKILIIGGHRYTEPNVGHHDPYYTAEFFDPEVGKFTSLCEISVPRVYHSTAVLLPDGRVWASGGEIPVGYTGSTQNIEVFSPGYLFEGERPVIQSAPTDISYGKAFTINTSLAASSIVLMRPNSVTHAIDMEQRYVELSIQSSQTNGGYTYDVLAPANANIAPPGYYMLFVLGMKNASTSGQTAIPSMAKWVKLS